MAEQGHVIRAHFERARAYYGERRAARVMRKFAIKYAELHPLGEAVRDAFVQSRNEGDWLRVLGEWYEAKREWPAGRRKAMAGDLVAAGAVVGAGREPGSA